jgi:hypothetical protein
LADAGLLGAACGVTIRSAAGLVDAFLAEPFFSAATFAADVRPAVGRAGAMRDGAPRCGTRELGLDFVFDFDFMARAGAALRAELEAAGRDLLPPARLFMLEGFFTFDLATEPLAPFRPELIRQPVSIGQIPRPVSR